MANKILITDTYHREIQALLGVSDKILPNTDIDAPSVLFVAEAKVIAAVPDYASLLDDDKAFLYAATIHMVAAILAPSMSTRIAKSKKDFDFSYEHFQIDWQKRGQLLMQEAYDLIDFISTQDTAEHPVFSATGPTRVSKKRGVH
ncbi:hypothetical protein [Paenibacillus sp. UMB4589-SE434]|uniref:hypothetical protein n=1 Tax=Paenibacillus sp. UMB4589-SE434 TaxID=3046314 RepID=UPI0025519E6C|nr:hypothetical protein [Paenibacillus sp. UMB4589-SE434]MDK8182109.1 hypothetical protein [Paenibacillus sp. UMB4589-SE434]